jgi:hypothetical protein
MLDKKQKAYKVKAEKKLGYSCFISVPYNFMYRHLGRGAQNALKSK